MPEPAYILKVKTLLDLSMAEVQKVRKELEKSIPAKELTRDTKQIARNYEDVTERTKDFRRISSEVWDKQLGLISKGKTTIKKYRDENDKLIGIEKKVTKETARGSIQVNRLRKEYLDLNKGIIKGADNSRIFRRQQSIGNQLIARGTTLFGEGSEALKKHNAEMLRLTKTLKATGVVTKYQQSLKTLSKQYSSLNKLVKAGHGDNRIYRQQLSILTRAQRDNIPILGKGAKGTAKLNSEIKRLSTALGVAGQGTTYFGTNMGIAIKKVMLWAVATGVVYGTIRAFRGLVSEFVRIQEGFIGIKKVMPTHVDIQPLKDFAMKVAPLFGVSVTDLTDIMGSFARVTKDTGQIISYTKLQLLLSTVTQLDNKRATEFLIATQAVWGLSMKQLMVVIDQFNWLTNTGVITQDELARALMDSQGAAKEAGFTFSELAGIITVLKATTGLAASRIGRSMRNIAIGTLAVSRAISQITEQYPELKIPRDIPMTTFERIIYVAKGLEKLSKETGKSGEEIFKLNVKTKGGNKTLVQYALALSGSRRAVEGVIPIFTQYRKILEVVGRFTEAEGSALEELNIMLSSQAAHARKLNAAWGVLAMTIGKVGILKALTSLTVIITALVKKLGEFIKRNAEFIKSIGKWAGTAAVISMLYGSITLLLTVFPALVKAFTTFAAINFVKLASGISITGASLLLLSAQITGTVIGFLLLEDVIQRLLALPRQLGILRDMDKNVIVTKQAAEAATTLNKSLNKNRIELEKNIELSKKNIKIVEKRIKEAKKASWIDKARAVFWGKSIGKQIKDGEEWIAVEKTKLEVTRKVKDEGVDAAKKYVEGWKRVAYVAKKNIDLQHTLLKEAPSIIRTLLGLLKPDIKNIQKITDMYDKFLGGRLDAINKFVKGAEKSFDRLNRGARQTARTLTLPSITIEREIIPAIKNLNLYLSKYERFGQEILLLESEKRDIIIELGKHYEQLSGIHKNLEKDIVKYENTAGIAYGKLKKSVEDFVLATHKRFPKVREALEDAGIELKHLTKEGGLTKEQFLALIPLISNITLEIGREETKLRGLWDAVRKNNREHVKSSQILREKQRILREVVSALGIIIDKQEQYTEDLERHLKALTRVNYEYLLTGEVLGIAEAKMRIWSEKAQRSLDNYINALYSTGKEQQKATGYFMEFADAIEKMRLEQLETYFENIKRGTIELSHSLQTANIQTQLFGDRFTYLADRVNLLNSYISAYRSRLDELITSYVKLSDVTLLIEKRENALIRLQELRIKQREIEAKYRRLLLRYADKESIGRKIAIRLRDKELKQIIIERDVLRTELKLIDSQIKNKEELAGKTKNLINEYTNYIKVTEKLRDRTEILNQTSQEFRRTLVDIFTGTTDVQQAFDDLSKTIQRAQLERFFAGEVEIVGADAVSKLLRQFQNIGRLFEKPTVDELIKIKMIEGAEFTETKIITGFEIGSEIAKNKIATEVASIIGGIPTQITAPQITIPKTAPQITIPKTAQQITITQPRAEVKPIILPTATISTADLELPKLEKYQEKTADETHGLSISFDKMADYYNKTYDMQIENYKEMIGHLENVENYQKTYQVNSEEANRILSKQYSVGNKLLKNLPRIMHSAMGMYGAIVSARQIGAAGGPGWIAATQAGISGYEMGKTLSDIFGGMAWLGPLGGILGGIFGYRAYKRAKRARQQMEEMRLKMPGYTEYRQWERQMYAMPTARYFMRTAQIRPAQNNLIIKNIDLRGEVNAKQKAQVVMSTITREFNDMVSRGATTRTTGLI